MKKRLNPKIEIDGILVTMLNKRTNLSKEILKTLNEMVKFIEDNFKIKLQIYESKIPIFVKTGKAILNKKSIIEYEPKNKVSQAYQDFTKEWAKS